MICNKCGQEIPDTAKFCFNCGASLNKLSQRSTINQTSSSSQFKHFQSSPQKKISNGCLIALCVPICIIILFFALTSNDSESSKEITTQKSITEEKISSNEVFEIGSYIMADGLKIKYEGNYSFSVKNTTDKFLRLSCSFYGEKKDGTYEWLGMPAFYGIDKERYNEDKEENGWAIEHTTNLIRPKKSLKMEMEIYDFGEVPFDVDEDGYYDIRFTVSPQKNETSVQTSTSDYETAYYRLKAK